MWIAALLSLACMAPPEKQEPLDPVADLKRREAFRAELQKKLGAAYDQPVPGLDQVEPNVGQRVWNKNCVGCHGSHGRGDGFRVKKLQMSPPAPDLLDPERVAFLSDAARYEILVNGSPGTDMHGLSKTHPPQYILAVFAHLKGLQEEALAQEEETAVGH